MCHANNTEVFLQLKYVRHPPSMWARIYFQLESIRAGLAKGLVVLILLVTLHPIILDLEGFSSF